MTPDYPVWTIRPNWREGVLERLEWLTDVLGSGQGQEQRRSLRWSPRQFIEITVHPTDNERSFLDLILHKTGSDNWLFPLWFDQGVLTTAAAATDTRVEFDNTYRLFKDGGYALLYRDTFTWEVVAIDDQDATGLNLSIAVDGEWPAGTKVYPLRLTQLPQDTSLDALTSRVGESVLLFQVIEPTDYTADWSSAPTFEGLPILDTPPNRSEALGVQHVRYSTDLDNKTGLPERTDLVGRAFQVQGHSWMVTGRQAQAEFRSFLYALKGRQKALWLPSFNQDFTVSRDALAAALALDIGKIGLTYTGGPFPGRDVALVGSEPVRIEDLGVPASSAEERLVLADGISDAIDAGTVGSFMSAARLNQDNIEITHHTDSDGTLECALTFRSFENSRDASGSIYEPIPAAAMTAGGCGTAATYSCLRILVTEAVGGVDSLAEMSRIQFLRNGVNGVEATPFDGATATASSTQAGSFGTNYPMMESQSVNEGWESWQSRENISTEECWYQVCFPEAHEIVGVTIMSGRGANSPYAPKNFKLQGSNDDLNWTDILTVTGETDWATAELRAFLAPDFNYTGSPWGARRCWRHITYLNNGNNSMAEIIHRAVPSGPRINGGTPSARNTRIDYPVVNAFDGNNDTLWSAPNDGTPPGKYNWVMKDHGADPEDWPEWAEVVFRARQDGFANYTGDGVGYQFADDPAGPWTTVVHQQGYGAWTNGQERTYTDPLYEAP